MYQLSSFSSLTQMPVPQCCWDPSYALCSLEQVRRLLTAARLSSRPERTSNSSHWLLLCSFTLKLHSYLLGVLFRGWGFFSNYWSLGQIVPHMPQHNNTARTELRPLLMLRMAFYGKYTGHGTRMCFKRSPIPQKCICQVASHCTKPSCVFEI